MAMPERTGSTGTTRSILRDAIDLLPSVRESDGTVHTVPFLQCARIAVEILEKFGVSMALVRADVNGNISRLDAAYKTDPVRFESFYEIVRKDIEDRKEKETYGNSNGMLWLTRAMDFILTFLNLLETQPDWTAYAVARKSYEHALQPFHGWITRQAFGVAMHLIPDRADIYAAINGGPTVHKDMKEVVALFAPIIQANKDFLASLSITNNAI